MAIRKLKNAGRRRAPFGTQEAAILAAAGINAATQMTAAGINSAATKQAAKDQAAAINASARQQSQAIKDQTERSKEYQEMSQEFIREQNAENRELQKDIQMQLQMLTGAQNVNDRLEASKIKVRNGGKTRRKLKSAGIDTSLLRGSYNLPFVVTDGGSVIPIGQTPEGYDLYEIVGNDHEHYHKAQGGKNKTGVGIKFADGNVVEGEGNQNTNQGEYLLNTPDNAYFISRHSIAGVNPAKMVNSGMHPLQAYAIQEQLKAANGISDDGKNNSSPVKRMMGGNFVYDLYNQTGPQPGVDTSGDTAVGIASNSKRLLRCGGKARRKAADGLSIYDLSSYAIPITSYIPELSPNLRNTAPVTRRLPYTSNNTRSGRNRFWSNADLWGAGIGAVGNLGGAWITSDGNRRAARTLANAYGTAADTMAEAYRSLRTIDMDSLRREDYAAAHAMPALQAPVSFAQSQLAQVDRQLQRRLDNAARYSTSSAAAQDRMARAEIDAQDLRNRIYSADQEQMQKIRQANAERVTQAALANAQLDTEANKQFGTAYLDLLQYNNDIENQKILGSAGAISEGAVNAAGAMSSAQASNAQAWANALVGSSQGFTNSLSAMADRRAKVAAALLGADSDSQASYYANLASKREAKAAYYALRAQYDATTDADTKKRLARQINNIASHRGLDFV